jgi:hypothetical protein
VTSRPVCPECATPVEVDWEWCHGCGFDPEGKLAEARARGLEPAVLTPSLAVSPAAAFPGATPPQALMADGPARPAPRAATAPDVSASAVSPLSDADSWDHDALLDETLLDEPVSEGAVRDERVGHGSSSDETWSDESWSDESWSDESWGDDVLATTAPSDGQQAPAGNGFDDPRDDGYATMAPSFGSGEDLALESSYGSTGTFEAFPSSAGGAHGDVAPPVASPYPSDAPAPAATGAFAPGGWQNDPPPPKPAGALNPQAGGPKMPVLIGLGIVAFLVIGFVFIKMGSNERPKVDTSNGPPPAGEAVLNITPSTVPPVTVTPGWVEYRAPDGRFIAGFPLTPTQKNVLVVVGSRALPAVEVGAQEGPAAPAFAVNTVEIPADFPIPDAQTAFDRLAQHFEITGSEPYAANGLDGVRFTARTDGADLTGVVYVRGSRLYYLAAVGADPVSFDQFAASFQLPTGR